MLDNGAPAAGPSSPERHIVKKTGTSLVLLAGVALGVALDRVLAPAPGLVVSAAAAQHAPASRAEEPARLDLARLFVSTKEGTRVAPAVEALRGRRVRVVGYMARMEDAPRGSFYLTRNAVEADESGAGTADLPPDAVRVEVPRLSGAEVAWVSGLIDASGTLEVGRSEDKDGRVSWLRVILDAPGAATRATPPPVPQKPPASAPGGVTRSECQQEHP